MLYKIVSDFKATFSDCHSKISFKILAHLKQKKQNNSNFKDFPLRYIWKADSVLKFQESFTHPAIQNDIKQFMDEDINFDETSINNATNKLHCIFEKVCKASLKRKKGLRLKVKNGMIVISLG